eukprot:CAMPEP_0169142826 /NCGR_PEP_ID=MMETSP1015-20121227/45199_1 /TAXON_ID=342587 /ORGANISM="Karlodinium micrum, Strain CCMP2283" /LENGTH=332 /DNA_ID=CAMNT_0009209603 /DNA_START=98 /DNA_END=1096 /DNA_ORIENTATION=+
MSFEELKRAYHKNLRGFHPDKRGTSTGFGIQQTQALNQAWEELRNPARRETYDQIWKKEHSELQRAAGNRHYKQAQALSSEKRPCDSSVEKEYQAAIEAYSEGIRLCPTNHRLWSNRSVCYAALKDWSSSREDASQVTQLEPTFAKGWLLLAKAMWKGVSAESALDAIDVAFHSLPGNADLEALRAEIRASMRCKRQAIHSSTKKIDEKPCASQRKHDARELHEQLPHVVTSKSESLLQQPCVPYNQREYRERAQQKHKAAHVRQKGVINLPTLAPKVQLIEVSHPTNPEGSFLFFTSGSPAIITEGKAFWAIEVKNLMACARYLLHSIGCI